MGYTKGFASVDTVRHHLRIVSTTNATCFCVMYWRAYLGGAMLAPVFIWQVINRQVSVPMYPLKLYKSASVSHMIHCACYVAWASTLNSPQILFWACLLPAYYVCLAH